MTDSAIIANRGGDAPSRSAAVKKVIGKTKNKHGRKGWRVVANNGQVRTIFVTTTSVNAMNDAVAIYGPALKRLADR